MAVHLSVENPAGVEVMLPDLSITSRRLTILLEARIVDWPQVPSGASPAPSRGTAASPRKTEPPEPVWMDPAAPKLPAVPMPAPLPPAPESSPEVDDSQAATAIV